MMGNYKSAGEPFLNYEMSPYMRESIEALLATTRQSFVERVAERREREPAQIESALERTVLTAREVIDGRARRRDRLPRPGRRRAGRGRPASTSTSGDRRGAVPRRRASGAPPSGLRRPPRAGVRRGPGAHRRAASGAAVPREPGARRHARRRAHPRGHRGRLDQGHRLPRQQPGRLGGGLRHRAPRGRGGARRRQDRGGQHVRRGGVGRLLGGDGGRRHRRPPHHHHRLDRRRLHQVQPRPLLRVDRDAHGARRHPPRRRRARLRAARRAGEAAHPGLDGGRLRTLHRARRHRARARPGAREGDRAGPDLVRQRRARDRADRRAGRADRSVRAGQGEGGARPREAVPARDLPRSARCSRPSSPTGWHRDRRSRRPRTLAMDAGSNGGAAGALGTGAGSRSGCGGWPRPR